MGDVYFVQTPHFYEPYSDLFTLARLSGYPVITLDEMDVDSDNLYVIAPLNAEWERRWEGPVKATICLFDLEWRLKESDYAWPESALTVPPFVSRVWASDKWYAERIGAQYVPLGSHAGLAEKAPLKDTGHDVIPLSYRTGRRNASFGDMERLGLTIAPNAWGEDRAALLHTSQAVVHVHQHDRVPTVAPLRYALAAAYRKPLISEAVYDRGIFGGSVLFADYAALPDYTALMIRRYPELLQAKADMLHELLCVRGSFKSYIEAAL